VYNLLSLSWNALVHLDSVFFSTPIYNFADPSGHMVQGVVLQPLACWDRGFEFCRGHGCLSLVSVGSWMSVSCECCVLSGRGLCDKLITHPEDLYWLWCVIVCDLETSNEETIACIGPQCHQKKSHNLTNYKWFEHTANWIKQVFMTSCDSTYYLHVTFYLIRDSCMNYIRRLVHSHIVTPA